MSEGIAVALYTVSVKAVYEINLKEVLTLTKRVMTDGSTLLLAADANLLPYTALGLIFVILVARIAVQKWGGRAAPARAPSSRKHRHVSARLMETDAAHEPIDRDAPEPHAAAVI